MPTFIDQTGYKTELEYPAKRIISIVPSQSEFLWDIGLKENMIGITKFCIHPDEMFRSVERVGGTKNLDIEKIRKLKPDLIIGNKEENEKSQIELLRKEFNVWMSDIYNFEDSFDMMKAVGTMTGKETEANHIIDEARASVKEIENLFNGEKVVYFIWNKPYMFAGKNTFIDYVLNYTGLNNAAGNLDRYPELSIEQLNELNPEFCFLSTEPFPFKDEHVSELSGLIPKAKVMIVDGEMFSWYGSRLVQLPSYIKELKNRL